MKNFIALIIVLALIVSGVIEWGYAAFNAPGPILKSRTETVVVIKSGVGLKGVAQALADQGAIERPQVFQIGVRVLGKTALLKAGEYAIPARATMREIMEILIAGKSIQHKVTVAEGLTSEMAYDIVRNAPDLKGAAGPVPPEGSLLPETYLFQRGETRANIIAKMQKARADLVDRLWETRAAELPIKTKEEALVLASIVEKETGIPSERPHIAAVFINRLRIGMKLESDPTIIYGITKGYPIGRRLKASEVHAVTPYNTYVIVGLPPQPICNPGKDSIAAVLNPAVTKDLYFVANGTGGHVFSETIEEQTKNVIAWRKIHLKGEK